MRVERNGKHAQVIFDSFSDIVDFHADADNDKRSSAMRANPGFHGGAKSINELVALARTGMPREGIDALAIAEDSLQTLEHDLESQQFNGVYDVSGSDVDVARYLSGEPECMINYEMNARQQTERVVTLVVALGVSGAMSTETMRKRGQQIVALAEAIDRTGLQTEIWAEFTTGGEKCRGYTGRIQVRLKSPGELFDAGMFMFALTHAGFYRGFLFNATWQLPTEFHAPMTLASTMGKCVFDYIHSEDYPDNAIYMPIISWDAKAEQETTRVLRELGLLV